MIAHVLSPKGDSLYIRVNDYYELERELIRISQDEQDVDKAPKSSKEIEPAKVICVWEEAT